MVPVFDKPEYKRMLKHKWREIIPTFIRDLRCCVQRCRKGYCYRDLWNIDIWFLNVMPDMLREFRSSIHGYPYELTEKHNASEDKEKLAVEEWDEILEKMAFLFQEADEDTCKKENLYQAEHDHIQEEFEQKYGMFGEKLWTPEEKVGGRKRLHFAHELPEYKEIEEKYMEEERKIAQYRVECKDEAFQLFSYWFYHLWD